MIKVPDELFYCYFIKFSSCGDVFILFSFSGIFFQEFSFVKKVLRFEEEIKFVAMR